MNGDQMNFITNHGAVALYLAAHPDHTMREVAQGMDITERTVARIISRLKETGYLMVEKNGHRNRYHIDKEKVAQSLSWNGFRLFDTSDDVTTP